MSTSRRNSRSRNSSLQSRSGSRGSRVLSGVKLNQDGRLPNDDRMNYLNLAYEQVHPDGHERKQMMAHLPITSSLYSRQGSGHQSGPKPHTSNR